MSNQEENTKYLQAAKIMVLEKAVEYARLKIFGVWLDASGKVNRYSLDDEKARTEYALAELGRAAEFLLHEMTLQVDATTLPVEEKEAK